MELHSKKQNKTKKHFLCDLKSFSLTNSKHWLQKEVINKLLKGAYKNSKLEVVQNPRLLLGLSTKITTLA